MAQDHVAFVETGDWLAGGGGGGGAMGRGGAKGGGGAGDCRGDLKINEINNMHNTDCCYVIKYLRCLVVSQSS